MNIINKLKKILGVTQEELADLAATSQSTISRLSKVNITVCNKLEIENFIKRISLILKNIIENLDYKKISTETFINLYSVCKKYNQHHYFLWFVRATGEFNKEFEYAILKLDPLY